ncbi:GTP 3',8-cyclase MoaA [Fodinibacter luteus]|uniref:GTP 3',8-cyclase n=1 Tax=Fodinibacter luteus TaxID=552064 RepID=A0ABP8KAX3_9MICO
MTDLPAPRLLDQFGRVGRDLRVSVTDRCNLRCTYCMPAEGLDWLPKPEMLTDDELVRLVAVMVGLGVTQVRLTGGEPLLRRSLVDVVRRVASLHPRPRIAMTTNGIGLDRLAAPLAAAGLDRVNVSLDTIDPEHFSRLTRRDRFNDVVAGLKAAADAGLSPVKVNAVAMRGVNDTDVPDLLRWCLDRGYDLRFIEQMPLDAQHAWDRSRMVSQAEVLERLGTRFRLTPVPERGSAPAELFLVDGGPATVGVIASVSAPFCGSCDRVRLTADGQLRNCLFARREVDLRGPLRAGASDDDLAELVVAEMWAKKPGHGIDRPDFEQPQRPMSAIGG